MTSATTTLAKCSHTQASHRNATNPAETTETQQASTTYTFKLPYTAYRGAFIGDHYRLQQLRLQTEFLDIFSVVCLCGRVFEAQAFSLSCPASRGKLLESRRRRMKRIYRSDNFVDVFEQAGRRFLVTKVDRTEKEWSDVCRQVMRGGDDFALDRPARLLGWGGARCSVEDERTEYVDGNVCAPHESEPIRHHVSYVEPTSYAGAVMKGLRVGK
ncbi:hypothetical protein PFICI_09997 [Pestalotiopsis fici W106-1]|uniref:Uncharacterized protein n=1 Tax=Pestalotiopsis fici (strain W106-1 / CGMCC3.15140) TaxID=1229662 RepID=W3WVQ8_PESFW|nr:uncharacterized protein PFICI_09997 [Pestalotiopsis fici W106-1]ETS77935.1 hypothetical protein PFICI_09997 [Pestalotiopsis fici W106-1]